MGLLDKLFGPPSKDRFAQMFIEALRRAGDRRSIRYDAEQFRLLYDDEDSLTYLGNMYAEFCRVRRKERAEHLSRFVKASLSHMKEMPDDFADASHDLRPKVWPRATLEKVGLEAEVKGQKRPRVPSIPIGEHLLASLVYDLPEAVRTIGQENLDEWNVSFYQTMEIAQHNLETTEFAFARIGESLYSSVTGDNYDASRLLLQHDRF